MSRLNFLNELVWKVSHFDEFGDSREYLDSIELHAGLCFQIEGGDKYSWFVSHASWVEGGLNVCRDKKFELMLQELISSDTMLSSSEYEFLDWMGRAGSLGCQLLQAIESTQELSSVLGALISLQAWAALILSKASFQRQTEWVWN